MINETNEFKRKDKTFLQKYIPYIVLACVIIASGLAFMLGGNIYCLRSGGTSVDGFRCTQIQVEKYTICPPDISQNRYVVIDQQNATLNVTG